MRRNALKDTFRRAWRDCGTLAGRSAAARRAQRVDASNRCCDSCRAALRPRPRPRSIYEKIGKGKHSVVYKGRKKKTIQYYAVKSVEKSQKGRVLQEVRRSSARVRVRGQLMHSSARRAPQQGGSAMPGTADVCAAAAGAPPRP
jgi:hypothetical protein